MAELMPPPDLGMEATVVLDTETHLPRVVSDEEKQDWRDVGSGFMDDIRVVSLWSAHIAVSPHTLAAHIEIEPGIISRTDELTEESYMVVRWLAPGEDWSEGDFEQAQEMIKAHWREDD